MATFRGTYTADEGERPAAGSVTVTSDTGATASATLDADGAYSLVVAGSRFTVAESITGAAARSFEVSARSDGTVDTGRDVGAVLASSLSVSGTPADGDVVTFDATAGHAKWAAGGGGGGPVVAITMFLRTPAPWATPEALMTMTPDVPADTGLTSAPILLTAPFTGWTGFAVSAFLATAAPTLPFAIELFFDLNIVALDGETFGRFTFDQVFAAGDNLASTLVGGQYVTLVQNSVSDGAVFDISEASGAGSAPVIHPPSAGPWIAQLAAQIYPA